MRKLITTTLIVIITTVSIFGFIHMSHDAGCSLQPGNSGDCPLTAMTMIAHHLDSYAQWSSVVVNRVVISILFEIMAIAIIFAWWARLAMIAIPIFAWKQRHSDAQSYCRQNHILYWLSLFENSPTFE